MQTYHNAQTYNVYLNVETFILHKIIVNCCGAFLDGRIQDDSPVSYDVSKCLTYVSYDNILSAHRGYRRTADTLDRNI